MKFLSVICLLIVMQTEVEACLGGPGPGIQFIMYSFSFSLNQIDVL